MVEEQQSLFSKRLKGFRTEKGLTQQEIADLLDINRVSYARWEDGTREPTLENVVKLAQILGTTTDKLLGKTKFVARNSVKPTVFSQNLYNERRKLGLSQESLGEKIGVHQVRIAKWENGKTEPSFENLIKLAEVFGTSVDYLLGRG